MMEAVLVLARWLAYGVLFASILLVSVKVAWNIGLPYAMIRERRRGVRRGWSIFPAIEIVPLLLAIGLAFAVSATGWLSPRTLGIGGLALIAGSYLHLAIVSVCYGVWSRQRQGK